MSLLNEINVAVTKKADFGSFVKNKISSPFFTSKLCSKLSTLNPFFNKNNIKSNSAVFIKNYVNDEVFQHALEVNPNIKRILLENNLSVEYNLDNVISIIMSHLIPCSNTAQSIYRRLGHNELEEDFLYLTQAALLHDIGKAFIPASILNKRTKLTKKEREIIELHNRLSYEILITTNLNKRVAQLALEHHNYSKNLKRSEANQVLTTADIYCALKEKRPYKKPLNELKTRMLLYDMSTRGDFDPKYISFIK